MKLQNIRARVWSLEERTPDGTRGRSGAGPAGGAVSKAQSNWRRAVVGRYGRTLVMTARPGKPATPSVSTMRTASTRAVIGADRRPRRGAAPLGPLRPPDGRRTALRRGSPLGIRLRSPPAAPGPDRHDGEPGGALASCAQRPAAERIGVRLDVRPGELPAPPANAALEDTAPAGPGAPVALPRRHSRVQLAGISAPSRYRSR